jgi:iron complex outermembrane receptor protein
LGTRIGWRKDLKKKNKLELFAGIDNAFDVTYSLGNDINAAGGRYYNAAPGRNYYGGVSLSLF